MSDVFIAHELKLEIFNSYAHSHAPGVYIFRPLFFLSFHGIKDRVARRATIKVEINFLIRFTWPWLPRDAASEILKRYTRLKECLPRNLKFLIKLITDRGVFFPSLLFFFSSASFPRVYLLDLVAQPLWRGSLSDNNQCAIN